MCPAATDVQLVGEKQLVLALQRGGYRTIVEPLKAQPREGGLAAAMSVYSFLHHHASTLARRLLALYYGTLSVWGWPRALWMRAQRFNKFLLVVGYPSGES